MSKTSRLCRVSAAALPCAFLRLRKRSQSEGRVTVAQSESRGSLLTLPSQSNVIERYGTP